MKQRIGLYIQLSLLLFVVALTDGAILQKVVGGRSIEEKAAPFMASILCSIGFDRVRLCGGTIIHSRWILTAAHCLESVGPSDVRVYVGSTKFAGGSRQKVRQLVIHERYDGGLNDIALIELASALSFGDGKKIRLNSQPIAIGTEATLIGWGLVSAHQNPHIVAPLQSAQVRVTQCNGDPFQDIHFPPAWMLMPQWGDDDDNDDDDSIICTSTRGRKGACVGDSGGPLVASGKQIGVVSRGAPCATGEPDSYTKVQTYVPWIEKRTGVLFRV